MCVVFVVFFLCSLTHANELDTNITKSVQGPWKIKYSSNTPMQRMVFKRAPDSSRTQRWISLSEDFEMVHEAGKDIVRRKDLTGFRTVEFEVVPTYVSLPKDYAPFSPFSDGGMLFHSGRFFACADNCTESINRWKMHVQAPETDNIIVNGRVYNNAVTWMDSGSGTKVYVGSGQPIQDANVVSLVDTALPNALKDALAQNLPRLLSYFSQHMGKLDYRPTLYASFSQTNDGRYGHQGGTLPGQIFMHWYGEQAISRLNEQETFLFFAHEVAHLYQRQAGDVESTTDAWLHEGSAEFFAAIAHAQLTSDKQTLYSLVQNAKQQCIDGFSGQTSYLVVSSNNIHLHYRCGMLIFAHLQHDLSKRNRDVFELWDLYSQAVKAGKSASASTFVNAIRPIVSDELWLNLNEFVLNPAFNSKIFFTNMPQDELFSVLVHPTVN